MYVRTLLGSLAGWAGGPAGGGAAGWESIGALSTGGGGGGWSVMAAEGSGGAGASAGHLDTRRHAYRTSGWRSWFPLPSVSSSASKPFAS